MMPSDSLKIKVQKMKDWRIAICAIAMCGIQVCYAAQINLGTSTLLLLGLSEKGVSLAWLAGPISGLVVQPLVGLMSDSCTSSFGRRRPFLVAGTLFTSAALFLFSNASEISESIFGIERHPKLALYIGIFSFFLLDFSIQAIQAPLRALVTDVVPGDQRALANAYVGFFTGMGNLLGGVLTAVDLKQYFPFFKTDVQALFASAIFVLVSTVLLSVIFTHEEPLVYHSPNNPDFEESKDDSDCTDVQLHSNSQWSPADSSTPLLSASYDSTSEDSNERTLYEILLKIPNPFWKVFAVQLCTWCGFFTLFVYVNAWVGENIYLGDAKSSPGTIERENFDEGVRLGGRGNAITAVVTIVYAMALPTLLRTFGVTAVYAFSQFVEAICLLIAPMIRGKIGQSEPSLALKYITLVDIGLFGVVWATTMGVPWTLIGDALDSDPWYAKRIGLFTTLFNASQSFPQLVVAFASPSILSYTENDPSYVMFVGGCCASIGIVLVMLFRLNNNARRIMRISSSATMASLSRLHGRYADVISHSDFLGIFEKSFDNFDEMSEHADNTATWMAQQ